MNVLTSAKDLIDLLKNVDDVYHSKPAASSNSKLSSLCGYVPSISEQLQVSSSSLSFFFILFLVHLFKYHAELLVLFFKLLMFLGQMTF